MVVIQRIATRPSLDIPFFTTTDDFLAYRDATYINTGRLIYEAIRSDEFNLTRKLSFPIDADYDAYDTDPKVLAHRAEENAYYERNGVISNRTVTRS